MKPITKIVTKLVLPYTDFTRKKGAQIHICRGVGAVVLVKFGSSDDMDVLEHTQYLAADDLREVAQLFSELADALDEEASTR